MQGHNNRLSFILSTVKETVCSLKAAAVMQISKQSLTFLKQQQTNKAYGYSYSVCISSDHRHMNNYTKCYCYKGKEGRTWYHVERASGPFLTFSFIQLLSVGILVPFLHDHPLVLLKCFHKCKYCQ